MQNVYWISPLLFGQIDILNGRFIPNKTPSLRQFEFLINSL